ncbi:MAG: hypothetical protein D6805_08300 [Planctomycetota bacterium]|nr:MAG: hypothetical protein D6805_08300 [Planctomycetota bacterium]
MTEKNFFYLKIFFKIYKLPQFRIRIKRRKVPPSKDFTQNTPALGKSSPLKNVPSRSKTTNI